MDDQVLSSNKTYNDLFSLTGSAAEGEGGLHGEETQPSWFAPGGFQIKPIWQSVAESLLPERAVTMLLLALITLKFIYYATSMMDASMNLQQLVLYRSQFYFVGDSFVRVWDDADDARKKAQSWYITRPVLVKQFFANSCIVYGLFFATELSRTQLYSLGAGVGLYFLVNVVWNRGFLLFTKPNLAHAYQAKQYCLMNMHFFLCLIMVSFVMLHIEDMRALRYYKGPMHVVGLGMENQTTPCDSYARFRLQNKSYQGNNFSYARDCRMPEYQAKVQVAWGGKWGCPKFPTKHCQATVDYVQSEIGIPDSFKNACRSVACKMVKRQEEMLLWDIYPCNRYIPKRFRSLQNTVPNKDHLLAGPEGFLSNHGRQEEVCSLDEYLDDPANQVKACLTKRFHNNFDANDFTIKKPVQSIHGRKPLLEGEDDALSGYVGDCNTCTIKRNKQRMFTDPSMVFVLSYFFAMLFLAGWYILSTLEQRYGWCATPETLVVRPVKGIVFWDFFFLTSSFFN